MNTKSSIILFIVVLLLAIQSTITWKAARTFKFKNSCSKTIWIGGFGVPLMAQTGWEMPPHTETSVTVAANTVAIRYWARTGCNWRDGKFVCSTGDCGAPLNNFGVECRGITGQSPSTLVELTLSNSGNPDFYDMSNVDGNNLNVRFGPIPGTYQKVNNPDLGKFNCGSPSCTFNQNSCPQELKLQKSDGSYCMSICAAVNNNEQVNKYPNILGPIANDKMKKDLVCCACGEGTGGCTDPNSHFCCSPFDPRQGIGGRCYVENWPKPSQFFDRYDRVFKNQCNEAYSWQFDDLSSTYQCIDGDYQIEFF